MRLLKLANLDPIYNNTKCSPEEEEARKITAERCAEWGRDVVISEKSAHYLLEVIVGIAHSAYIAGQANGMMQPSLRDDMQDVFLRGVELGKQIERETRGE